MAACESKKLNFWIAGTLRTNVFIVCLLYHCLSVHLHDNLLLYQFALNLDLNHSTVYSALPKDCKRGVCLVLFFKFLNIRFQ